MNAERWPKINTLEKRFAEKSLNKGRASRIAFGVHSKCVELPYSFAIDVANVIVIVAALMHGC
jgi:hypothetical protein